MKKFFTIFFVVLGVLFLIQIILITYFVVADPFNLKPLFFSSSDYVAESIMDVSPEESVTDTPASQKESVDAHPALSESQEAALESVGINPASLPSTISPEQEQCFIEAIGSARVEEIKAGGSPTPTEIFRARGCL